MAIPLVDLSVQYRQVEEEIREAFERIMSSGAFVLGPDVELFEKAYAILGEVPHCVGVANGTDALELALRSLSIGPGDEVIVPANTFIASALAIARAGAKPVFVDVDTDYLLIDSDAAISAIGGRTRAIMAVDLFGQVAPMEPLEAATEKAGIALVEDAAQSQGARRNGRAAGSFGDVAGTSFYPSKNLGAFGDAGAITTRRDDVALAARRLRNYGGEVKYHHPEVGFNSRLDTLQAAVLNAKLGHLAEWNEQRRVAATLYHELLADFESVQLPEILPGNESVWHLYAIRLPDRDEVLEKLNARGIGAGVHYPIPIHLQGAFQESHLSRGAFPVSEAAADEMISLPLFPGITPDQQAQVVDELRRAMATKA